eukprot:3526124-Amphidinium_carterae.1
MKQRTRLVLQYIRRGATRPEDHSPTPSLTGMKGCLLMTAGRGASVYDISSAFLCADLPEESKLCAICQKGRRGREMIPGLKSLTLW